MIRMVSFKEFARNESIVKIEYDYEHTKREYPQISKTEYCKSYDVNAELLIKNKIENFKKQKAGLFRI